MTEREIIDRILSGDSDDFALIVDKYKTKVYHVALGFVRTKEDAEDLSQEIFVRVYNSLHCFRGESEFSTWLYRVAVNTSLNHVSSMRRRDIIHYIGDAVSSFFSHESSDRNPHQQLEHSQTEEAVAAAIESLADKQKTAFVLSRYEKLSQAEIARIMQIGEGAVEQHLQRARKNLQKKLSHIVGKK